MAPPLSDFSEDDAENLICCEYHLVNVVMFCVSVYNKCSM